jgi:hypothetical protein
VAQLSPLNLASSDKDLSLLASDPLFHVRVLADTSVLVSIVSDNSEESLESFTHSHNKTSFSVS